MGITRVTSAMIKDGDVRRQDLNTSLSGSAVISKVIAGTGISLSSTGADAGTGDVTINASGGSAYYTWNHATANATMAVNNAYVADSSLLPLQLTLPASAALGDRILVVGKSSAGWQLFQNTGQQIVYPTGSTLTGTSGYLQSSISTDMVELVCTTANTTFTVVEASQGVQDEASAYISTVAALTTVSAHNVVVGQGTAALTGISPGTAGQVLTSNGASSNPTFQTPVPTMLLATDFSASGKYPLASNGGSGTATFSTGLSLDTGATSGSFASLQWYTITGGQQFAGKPTFSCHAYVGAVGTTGDLYLGLGFLTCSGAGITFTNNHVGFKIVNGSLYATQADGTTETASAALTTVASGDELDLICQLGTSGCTYYYRKNSGSLSAGTTLSTHFPSTSTVNYKAFFAVSNHSTTNDSAFTLDAASYQR